MNHFQTNSINHLLVYYNLRML